MNKSKLEGACVLMVRETSTDRFEFFNVNEIATYQLQREKVELNFSVESVVTRQPNRLAVPLPEKTAEELMEKWTKNKDPKMALIVSLEIEHDKFRKVEAYFMKRDELQKLFADMWRTVDAGKTVVVRLHRLSQSPGPAENVQRDR